MILSEQLIRGFANSLRNQSFRDDDHIKIKTLRGPAFDVDMTVTVGEFKELVDKAYGKAEVKPTPSRLRTVKTPPGYDARAYKLATGNWDFGCPTDTHEHDEFCKEPSLEELDRAHIDPGAFKARPSSMKGKNG